MSDQNEILEDEHRRLQRLREASGGRLEFLIGPVSPPQQYLLTLHCRGLYLKLGLPTELGEHQVQIDLGPAYPVKPPQLVWRTPIYHPNILGWQVCLLGHWGAKTHLDDVCIWLWDMVRYRLYNLDDPLDSNASRWAAQDQERFPLDPFDLRAVASAAAPPPGEKEDLAGRILLLEDAAP